jgi:hypothetical protein
MKSLKELLFEDMLEKMAEEQLVYRNQLEFKKYFVKRAKEEGYKMLTRGKLSFQKTPFEIDNIAVYDGYTEKNIPNVSANGDLTFDAAYNAIVNYYKETQPNWFK